MVNNNEKILKALENLNELITTTELANKTGIDVKNISRYLKALENKGFITRKTIQNGKLRVVKIGLRKIVPQPITTPKPIKIEELKQPQVIQPKPHKTIIDYEGIDFNKIANSSEFKRFIFMIRTGSTFRGSNTELDKKLVKTEQTINVVKGLPRELLIELKEALTIRKAKLELT